MVSTNRPSSGRRALRMTVAGRVLLSFSAVVALLALACGFAVTVANGAQRASQRTIAHSYAQVLAINSVTDATRKTHVMMNGYVRSGDRRQIAELPEVWAQWEAALNEFGAAVTTPADN